MRDMPIEKMLLETIATALPLPPTPAFPALPCFVFLDAVEETHNNDHPLAIYH